MAAAEAELARGVATARVQAPAAPRRVQTSTLNIIIRYILISTPTFGVRLSEQAVQLLPLPEHLEAGGVVPAVCLCPAGHQPGRVEDAEEAPAYTSPLRPEWLQEAVTNNNPEQRLTLAGNKISLHFPKINQFKIHTGQ